MKPGTAGRSTRVQMAGVAATLALLVLGLIPAAGGGLLRSTLRSLRSLEPNRTERAQQAAGYYVGLIDGGTAGQDELSLRLVGKPPEWIHFKDIGAARFLRHEFLQFELKPDVDAVAFGEHFTTNSLGMRDRPYALRKPPGTFRILLLGSSMDMGWGAATEATYENQLEDWLNARAAKLAIPRRFEVFNLAMAAYSPLHRLDCFVRKAALYEPDLVIYSATRLDTRLLQIHLVGLLQERTDLTYDFVRAVVEQAGIDPQALERDPQGRLRPTEKDRVKVLLEPWLWPLEASAIAQLQARCRSAGLPLVCVVIPRANDEDMSESRTADVGRLREIARGVGVPFLDLSAAFDEHEPAEVEIAPHDDHPNALGHRLLFLELGKRIVANPEVHRLIFGRAVRE